MNSVLVVEDEAVLGDSLKEWLTDSGYRAEIAREGEEALEAMEQMDFDLMLLDLRLPGKDGLEVLREARLKKPEVKSIIITAYPQVESAVEAMKLGVIDYLTKPLDLDNLEKLVALNVRSGEIAVPHCGPGASLLPVLQILDRAAEDSMFLAKLVDHPEQALGEYDLSDEEREALAAGDMNKIESWVGELDEHRATWLWCRLCQEKW